MNLTGETQQPPAARRLAPEPSASTGKAPWRGIAVIAVAAFAAEMAVSARYGYVRDELYFLSAGHHLAFGHRGPAAADAAACPGGRGPGR